MNVFSQDPWAQLNGMGGPDEEVTPANSGIPLIEGGNPAWNDYLQYVPEENRQEAAQYLKKQDEYVQKIQEDFKPWQDLSKSGIDAERAQYALQVQAAIENNPQMVYETLGKHLGISTQQAKNLVEETNESTQATETQGIDPNEFAKLKTGFETLAEYTVKQRKAQEEEKLRAEQDAQLETEFSDLRKRYGNFDEDEVIMRMMYKGHSAQDAVEEWYQKTNKRPNPSLMGAGGTVPRPQVSPEKLDSKGAKDLVAQMLSQANAERYG